MLFSHIKKKVSIIVSIALLISSGIIPSISSKADSADSVYYTGDYGESVSYSYVNTPDIQPTLILEGDGGSTPAMNNYLEVEKQPWCQQIDPTLKATASSLAVTFPLNNMIISGNISFGEYAFSAYRCVNSLHIAGVKSLPKGFINYWYSSGINVYIYGETLQDVPADVITKAGSGTIHVPTEELKEKFSSITQKTYWTVEVDASLSVDVTPLMIAVTKGQGTIGTKSIPDNLLTPLQTAVSEASQKLEDGNLSADNVSTMTKAINDALDNLEGNAFANLTQLIPTIKDSYQEEDYTTNSWKALQDKLDAAEKLTEDSNKSDIEEAISDLNDAVDALVSVKELKAEINKVKDEKYYTADSWQQSNIAAALQAAKSGLVNASADQVQTLLSNLSSAIQSLVDRTPLDLAGLKQEVQAWANFASTAEESYTQESWKEFMDAYNNAKRYAEMDPYDLPQDWTENNISQMINAITTTKNNLQQVSVDDVLQELQDLVDEIEEKDYKEENISDKAVWNRFDMALMIAKQTLENGTGTITNIRSEITTLRDAAQDVEDHLLPPDDNTDVGDDTYLQVTGSWKKLGDANKMTGHIPSGVTVNVKGGDGYWMEITGLDLSAMKNPMLEVEYTANGDTLQIATTSAGLDSDPITSKTESSGHYTVALDKATNMLVFCSNGDTLEYTMIRIYDDQARQEAKTKLTTTISNAEKLKKSDYTAASWAAVEKALAEAKNLPEDATQAEIEAANQKLTDAIAALKKVTGNTDTTPSTLKKGDTVTVGKLKYKVTNATKGKLAVAVQAPKSKTAKSLTIPATIKAKGGTYKVTSIAANAFKKCKKLKKITIGKNVTSVGKNAFNGAKVLKKITVKSTKLKKVGKNALKGIHKKAVVKVPKKKLKKYLKLWKKKGQKKTVKIK